MVLVFHAHKFCKGCHFQTIRADIGFVIEVQNKNCVNLFHINLVL
jgi:hypothetical protein